MDINQLKKGRICFKSILLHLYMLTLSVITSVANPERAGIQGLLPHIQKRKKENVFLERKEKLKKNVN